ncbi:17653_t:CDS:2, partial [Dentiscutata erythropus]
VKSEDEQAQGRAKVDQDLEAKVFLQSRIEVIHIKLNTYLLMISLIISELPQE